MPRAGCVRTKSLLVDSLNWSNSPPLNLLLELLASVELPTDEEAKSIGLQADRDLFLPSAPTFSASELLEALFLEDPKPVVMFDAPDPELIALRLLAALWPEIRCRFSLSTFALSPRKIGGKDLDLVFAPSNAKAKFSDWAGRRVDGRTSQIDRHRWTGTIIRRVFEDPQPRLLSDSELNLLGEREAESAAALRVALLWDELLDKLKRTPTAALGLLDIANSGMVNNGVAMKSLEPLLVEAMREAALSLSNDDAWDFVGALARKMQRYKMPEGRQAIKELVAHLAERSPDGAVDLLQQPDPKYAIDELIPSIALGLGKGSAPHIEQILALAPTDIVVRLIAQGGGLTRRIAVDGDLIERIGVALGEADVDLANRAGAMLLPFLVEDRQLAIALPVFNRLNSKEIAAELCRLGDTTAFGAQQLSTALIDQARGLKGLSEVRDVLLSFPASTRRDDLLASTIKPTEKDIHWLLDDRRLPEALADEMLIRTLERANESEFVRLLSDPLLGTNLVARLPEEALELLIRVVANVGLPMNVYVFAIRTIIQKASEERKFDIAVQVIGRCLTNRFEEDEISLLTNLLGIIGSRLEGTWAARIGLVRGLSARIVSRNLIAFDKAPTPARERIVSAIDVVAQTLHGRGTVELDAAANEACAWLMFDAERISYDALASAAVCLTPMLLRARKEPVSFMISALFPLIYRELPSTSEGPDLFRLLPFIYLDRSKMARQELVDAFMSSSWRAGDLALTACRCHDVEKILKRVASSYGGKEYLKRMENDLGRLDSESQRYVRRIISETRQ